MDVPVVNGSFDQPRIAPDPKKQDWEQEHYGKGELKPWYWGRTEPNSAAGVVVAAGTHRAGRADGKQAVRVDALLDADGNLAQEQLKTRLWDVRKGSRVTVSFDYSPTTDAKKCTSTGAEEQRKELGLQMRVDGKAAWQETVAAPTFGKITNAEKKEVEVGKPNWKRATYEFTAEADHPEVAFALPDVKYGKDKGKTVAKECHPMIAAVAARQRPIEVDKSHRKHTLPPAQAFKGNDRSDVGTVLGACGNSSNACTFTLNQRYSYGYYDRPRPVGEVYENCTFGEDGTAAALRDKRKVVYRERSFDSGTQAGNTQFLDSSSHDGLTEQDLSHDVSHAAPSQGPTKVPADPSQATAGKAAVHFAAAYEAVRDQPWQWSRTVTRDIDVITPKNHASWVEVSAARERADGHYTVTSTDAGEKTVHRLFITYDGPSRITSDRVFQRHGTLSPTEIERCKTHRPLPYTPEKDPVVPYDPKDGDVTDESLTPGTAVGVRPGPSPSPSASAK
ncbi:hypothetical protein [Streptomyces longispororuber]|uniref:hypothetical protein n=1 Tax=Streptomyces longispororuber TaxID=68230 RepID=UPI00167D7444|nr:hypothetical protein [Streptomyces longispororuber]